MAKTIDLLMSLKDGVSPKLGNINNNLQKTSGKAKALGKSFLSVGNIMKGAFVTGAVAGFVKSTIGAYETQVKAEKSVTRAIMAQGATAQQASQDLKEWQQFASKQQDITAFGDEDTLANISGLISQGFGKKDIKDIVAMSQDIARNTGDNQKNVIDAMSAYIKTGARAKILAKQYKLNADLLGKGKTESERLAEVWKAFEQSANKGASTEYLKTFEGQVESLKGRLADLNEPVGHLFSTLMGYGNDPNATFISTLDKAVVDATTHIDNMAKRADELGGGISGVGLACLEANPLLSLLFGASVMGKGVIVANNLRVACQGVGSAIVAISGIASTATGILVGLTATATACALAFAELIAKIGGYYEQSAKVRAQLDTDHASAVGAWQNGSMSVEDWKQQLSTHATGTNYFSGGATEVGEHGGEILNLPNGTQIIPHDISKQMRSGYSINCPVTIQGNVIGNEDFVNQIGQAISSRVSFALSNC